MGSLSFRTRLTIILYIISFTVSIFIFAAVMNKVVVNVEYTSYRQYSVDGERVYFVQNHKGTGYIFAINSRGKVEDLYKSGSLTDSRILAISTNEGNVYFVEETTIEQENSMTGQLESIPGYRVVCLNDDLNVIAQTSKFAMEDGLVLTGFSAEETGLFLTYVTGDGSNIKVFNVMPSNLKDPSDNSMDVVKIEGVRTKGVEETRFYSEALYKQGQLYTRMDNTIPTGIFVKDSILQSIVTNMRLSIGQILNIYAIYFVWYLAVLIIWFVILYLVIRMLENRNRSFYYICIAEVVLFVIVGSATIAVANGYQSARELEHSRFAINSMLGLADDAGLKEYVDYSDMTFYNSERYQQIRKALTSFVKREGNNTIFYDVMVVRLKDNLICASASGKNIATISDYYGSPVLELGKDLFKGDRYTTADFTLEGQDYRAVAVPDKDLAPDYALVGIIGTTSMDASVVVDNLGVFFMFLMVFAFASAVVVLIWFLHMRDLTILEQALADTALGDKMPERPATLGRDIKDMWDAVAEIHKRVEGMQYSKLRILEAYYRFAPKNIELLLEKNSIIEVHNGDERDFDGTMGWISVDIGFGKRLKKLDFLIEALGGYIKNHEAMIIGKSFDMSSIQMLFSDKEMDIVKSLVDMQGRLYKENDKMSFSMFLFRNSFSFGVIGSDDESTLYLYYEDKELVERMVKFVDSMHLGLVVTDSVFDRENFDGKVRFIGYGGRDADGELIRLYEILDVHKERERVLKIATLDRFNEALKLFYDKDFYLARNKFSDILKETPQDALVRWYVFESEKNLHESVTEDYMIVHL